MGLAQQLEQDMKDALKNKQKINLSVIRMVRAAIKKAEIDKKRSLTDEEILEVLLRELKQRKDSLNEFQKAGREDLAQKEAQEIAIIEVYLPVQLSQEELVTLVEEAIRELGVTSKKEMGKVMSHLMPKVKGKADGRHVQQLVQNLLG